MSSFIFPGFAPFLQDAASRLGHPGAEAPARRITPLSALANLCAQAGAADPAHAPTILAKADEFHQQLRVAALAADLMLAHVRQALNPTTETQPETPAVAAPEPTPAPIRRLRDAKRPRPGRH